MADMPPCLLDGALLGVSHPVLDLGEGLLDGIEVRRVWRQEPEPCAGCLYHLPDRGGLVRSKIIHDHDVTRFEHRHELLFDIGAEALAVDRSVEDARCGEAVETQRTQEGQRAPVAVRSKAAQALAFRPPSA